MAHRPSDPGDDRLLDRLAAAGPVLDDLYLDATDPASTTDRHRRHRTAPRRPRHARSHGHRTLVTLVALFIAIGGFLGAVTLSGGGSDPGTVLSSTPNSSTTTQSDAQIRSQVKDRIEEVVACGPTRLVGDWPAGWAMVGPGPDCETGFVTDPSGKQALVAIYPTPTETDPIGYWSPVIGWLPLDVAEAPGFDLDRYVAAYKAALADRVAGGGN
jgi:hypothetical protein